MESFEENYRYPSMGGMQLVPEGGDSKTLSFLG